MKVNKSYILSIILLLANRFLHAKERVFNAEELEAYKKLEKFDYDRTIPPYEPGPIVSFLKPILELLFNAIVFLTQGVGLVILLALLAAIVVLIVYFINKSGYTKTISEAELDDIEISEVDDISGIDLDSLLQQAIKAKDFRLAVRVRFLQVLKSLDHNKLIIWKNEKTNYDYLNEVTIDSIRTPFDEVTYLYEYTWYGEMPLDEDRFNRLQPSFDNLLKQIDKA